MRYLISFAVLGLILLTDAVRGVMAADGPVALIAPLLEGVGLVSCMALAWIYGLAVAGRPEAGRSFGGADVLGLALRPYQVVAGAALRFTARFGKEPAFDEVVPGLFLGRVPFARDRERLREVGIVAVIQLCAEFPNLSGLARLQGVDVVAIPILDGLAPSSEQLRTAVHSVQCWRSERRSVLIHCAQGHGRSGTVLAAVLLDQGLAADPEQALRMIREARPGARPAGHQVAALHRFHENRILDAKAERVPSVIRSVAPAPPSDLTD